MCETKNLVHRSTSILKGLFPTCAASRKLCGTWVKLFTIYFPEKPDVTRSISAVAFDDDGWSNPRGGTGRQLRIGFSLEDSIKGGGSCNSTYTRRSIEKLSRLEPQSFSIIKLNLWSGRPAIKSIRYESTIFRLFGQIFVSHKNGMEWDNQFPTLRSQALWENCHQTTRHDQRTRCGDFPRS